jgi:RNA polymerase sigma factor (sigma-70 family)
MAICRNGTTQCSVRASPEPDGLPDRALLRSFVAKGEEAAFAALLRRHGPMVLGVCRRVLGDDHEAEDACQLTFLTLARRAGAITKQDSLAAWLYGVAYRQAVKARAKAARKRTAERKVLRRAPAGPSEGLTWREVREALDQELSRLPEYCRAAFLLCYEQEKTQEEAARQLGWPRGTLKRRLERSRELLRQRLTRRGLTLSAALVAVALGQNTAFGTAASPLLDRILEQALTLRTRGHAPGEQAPEGNSASLPNRGPKPKTYLSTVLWLMLFAGALAPMGPDMIPPAARATDASRQGPSERRREVAGDDLRVPEKEKRHYTTDGFAASPMAMVTS